MKYCNILKPPPFLKMNLIEYTNRLFSLYKNHNIIIYSDGSGGVYDNNSGHEVFEFDSWEDFMFELLKIFGVKNVQ